MERAALAPSAVLALALDSHLGDDRSGLLLADVGDARNRDPDRHLVLVPLGADAARAEQPPYAAHAGVSAVLALAVVAIWAMAGDGYFWPVWPMLGLAALLALHRGHLRPGQRSLEVRVDELTRTRQRSAERASLPAAQDRARSP